jgi:hypothetical protein
LLARHAQMIGDIGKNRRQGSDAQGLVHGDGDMMFAVAPRW